jgi:hypothetical protein
MPAGRAPRCDQASQTGGTAGKPSQGLHLGLPRSASRDKPPRAVAQTVRPQAMSGGRVREFGCASSGAARLSSYLSFTVMFGWAVLAIGAYRSRTMGLVRSIALASIVLLPLGVLKGTEPFSIVGTLGLCVAFVPSGSKLLRDGPRPSRRSIRLALPATLGLGVLAYVSTLG